MKKRNVMIQTAVASALLVLATGVHAVTTSATSTVFAREILLGTTPAATALTLGDLTIISNVSIPANSTVYVYVKLNGASLSALPTFSPVALSAVTVRQADGSGGAGAGTGQVATGASLGTTTGTANPAAVAAGVDYVVFQVNTNAAVIGVGATLGTLSGLQVNNAAGLLTTNITASASVGIGAPATRFGALPAAASNYDAASAATTMASSAQGITFVAAAGTAGRIDLTTTPASINFTGAATATIIDLGSITATNGTARTAANAAYGVATDTLSAVVTAPAGFFAPLGTSGRLWVTTTANGCAAGLPADGALNIAKSVAFGTTAAAAAATTVTLVSTGANAPVSTTVYRVCMSIDGATAAVPGTPSLVATLVKGAGTAVDSNNVTSATNLWALAYNGSQVDVLNYIPAAVTGYIQTVRLINTGSVAATASVAVIDEATGVVGTPVPVGASIPAGGSLRVSQATIEAAIGVQAATVRPRLRFTAATNGLKIQSLFNNANGAYTNLSGIEQ